MDTQNPTADEQFANKDKLLGPAAPASQSDLADVEASATSGWAGGISGTVGGASYLFTTTTVGDPMPTGNNPVVLNEYTSMTIPAFWRGVQWLSRKLASLPKNVGKRIVADSKVGQLLSFEKDYNHYLDYILNDEANDLQTSLQFWECIVHHAIVWGNGYGLVVREDDGVTIKAIYLLPPDRVIPFRWAGKQWYALQMIYDYQRPQAQWKAVEASNVLHLPGFGFDGMRGYPVVQLFANNLRLGKSAEVFGEKYFSSGGNIGLAIETDLTLTPDQRADLQQQIREKHTGLDNAHLALVLQRGLKAKNLTMPQDTAQYLQTRQFSILDIARILGVEPFILYDYTGAKFDNLELMGNAAVEYSLDPWIKVIEAECSRKLLNTDEKRVDRLKIKVDVNDLTRGDPTQQATNANTRLLSGQSSVNEERAIQGKPLIGPEGDTFHTSVQLQAPKNPATPPTPPTNDPAPAPDPAAKFSHFSPLLEDVANRVGAKTTKATNAAILKHKDSKEQFTIWSNVFAEEQARFASDGIRPLLVTFAHLCPETKLAAADAIGQRYAAALRGYHAKISRGEETAPPDLKELIYANER